MGNLQQNLNSNLEEYTQNLINHERSNLEILNSSSKFIQVLLNRRYREGTMHLEKL